MPDRLLVLMNGVVAGSVARTARSLSLEYDEPYRHEEASTPLSLSLPLQVPRHDGSTVAAWISGLLPDNPEVLQRWAREFDTTTAPFNLLSTRIGEDCAGAVQFVREDALESVLARPGNVLWLDEEEIAERIVALRGDATAWLGPDFAGRFSLAGAQAKTALYREGDRWGLPSGAQPTTHILKPAIAGLDGHDLNEHLCLAAARVAGLPAAPSSITMFAAEMALVVERYDRVAAHGVVQRVHQEDLCQALSIPPERKYQADGGPAPADIASLLRDAVRPPTAGRQTLEDFRDALLWNWIIAGTDAHAKNYSVLLRGGQVRLAPMYDVASALAYPGVDELKLTSAMKLGGEYRYKAHRASTWPKVARELGLDEDETVQRAMELITHAPDAFQSAANASEVRDLDHQLPTRLLDGIARRAERCARQLFAFE